VVNSLGHALETLSFELLAQVRGAQPQRGEARTCDVCHPHAHFPPPPPLPPSPCRRRPSRPPPASSPSSSSSSTRTCSPPTWPPRHATWSVPPPINPRHRLSHAAPSSTPLPRAAPSLVGPGAGPPAPPGEEAPRALAQPRRGRGPLPRPDRFFEAMGHAAAAAARGSRRRQGGRARAGDLPVGGRPLRAARDRPAHGRYGEGRRGVAVVGMDDTRRRSTSNLVSALGPTFYLLASPRPRSFSLSLCAVLSEAYFQAGQQQQGHAAHHAQARRRPAPI